MVQHGSISLMDKSLDSDHCSNHRFLEQVDRLVSMKRENPTLRIGKHSGLLGSEQVQVQEERKQGIKHPKRRFMTLDAYQRRYGAPDPASIKCQKIDGVEVKGVDVIREEDRGIYTYIDETSNSVQRLTALSDDVILSDEQNSVIFNSAAKQLASAPKDESCVEVPSSSRGHGMTVDENVDGPTNDGTVACLHNW